MMKWSWLPIIALCGFLCAGTPPTVAFAAGVGCTNKLIVKSINGLVEIRKQSDPVLRLLALDDVICEEDEILWNKKNDTFSAVDEEGHITAFKPPSGIKTIMRYMALIVGFIGAIGLAVKASGSNKGGYVKTALYTSSFLLGYELVIFTTNAIM